MSFNESEYVERGQIWLMTGANNEQTDIVLHPEELFGLNYAISCEVERYLAHK